MLVVDQLEELFVACGDGQARARFAAAVVRWSAVAPVVITVRADHLAQVAELSDLAARVQAGVFLLGAMGETELRAAIEGPAAKAGLRLEPGLVDLMVRGRGRPARRPAAAVPRPGRDLRAAGRTGVVRRPATGPSAGCRGRWPGPPTRSSTGCPRPAGGPPGTCSCGWSRVTETSDPVRQRVPRATLAGDPTSAAVLDALVGSRLVIADETTVEIAHEAACRAWPRLRRLDRRGPRRAPPAPPPGRGRPGVGAVGAGP